MHVSACKEYFVGLRVNGHMPILGNLSIPEVVDVAILPGEGASVFGERGVVEVHGVIVIGQEVMDGDAAKLYASLLEDTAEQCQHLVAPVVVALEPGR